MVMLLVHDDTGEDHFTPREALLLQGLSCRPIRLVCEPLQLLLGCLYRMNRFRGAHDAVLQSSFRLLFCVHCSLIVGLICEILHEGGAQLTIKRDHQVTRADILLHLVLLNLQQLLHQAILLWQLFKPSFR